MQARRQGLWMMAVVLALGLALPGAVLAAGKKPAAKVAPAKGKAGQGKKDKAKPDKGKGEKPKSDKARQGKAAAAPKPMSAKEKKALADLRKLCADPKLRKKNAQCKALIAEDKKPAGKDSAKKDDSDDKPKALSAKEKKQLAAQRKACQDPKQKKTAKCKAFAAEEKERADAEERARVKKTCALAANKKSKQCKAFLAAEHKRSDTFSICGRRYGTAKKNEKIATFAKRYRVSESAVRSLNELAAGTKLKAGKRYLVYKSPHEGVVLKDGVLLEPDPEAFLMQRPQRGWGKPLAVEAIRGGIEQVQASNPLGPMLIVGDLSKDGGGCLPPHKSHRGGLDADIGYYMRGARQRSWLGLAQPDTVDADRTWQLLRAFLATGRLQYAFVDYSLQQALYEAAQRAGESAEQLARWFQYPRPIENAHETIIRHLGGHADHMHVRFQCDDPELCPLSEEAKTRIATIRVEQRGGVAAEAPVPRRDHAPYRSAAGVAVPAVMP